MKQTTDLKALRATRANGLELAINYYFDMAQKHGKLSQAQKTDFNNCCNALSCFGPWAVAFVEETKKQIKKYINY